MRSLQLALSIIALTLVASGCRRQLPPSPAETVTIELRAQSEDGAPIGGARWAMAGQALGETDAKGILRVTLRGREGQSTRVDVTCPNGFVAREASRVVHLAQKAGSGARASVTEAVCVRATVDVVLVVHVDGGSRLPVFVQGLAAGSTDGDGNGHVLMRVDRSVHTLDVALGASVEPNLRPLARSFDLDDRDSVIIFSATIGARIITKKTPSVAPKRVLHRLK